MKIGNIDEGMTIKTEHYKIKLFFSVKHLELRIMMVKISMDNESGTFGDKNLGRKNSVTTLET